jgi:hypothetical protein
VIIKYNKHGALASIEEGIAGLVHISEFGGEDKLRQTLELGKSYKFKITLFDAKEQKMALSYAEANKNKIKTLSIGFLPACSSAWFRSVSRSWMLSSLSVCATSLLTLGIRTRISILAFDIFLLRFCVAQPKMHIFSVIIFILSVKHNDRTENAYRLHLHHLLVGKYLMAIILPHSICETPLEDNFDCTNHVFRNFFNDIEFWFFELTNNMLLNRIVTLRFFEFATRCRWRNTYSNPNKFLSLQRLNNRIESSVAASASII